MSGAFRNYVDPPSPSPCYLLYGMIVEGLYCKRSIQCLASSEILTPHPLTARRVCTVYPPAFDDSPTRRVRESTPLLGETLRRALSRGVVKGGGRTHSPGGEGVGGQYFRRRQTLDWPLTVYSLYDHTIQ